MALARPTASPHDAMNRLINVITLLLCAFGSVEGLSIGLNRASPSNVAASSLPVLPERLAHQMSIAIECGGDGVRSHDLWVPPCTRLLPTRSLYYISPATPNPGVACSNAVAAVSMARFPRLTWQLVMIPGTRQQHSWSRMATLATRSSPSYCSAPSPVASLCRRPRETLYLGAVRLCGGGAPRQSKE